jgi:XTP/dITP diphosphohydrolase
LLLDEHFSPEIARQLRARGHDVIAVKESPELTGRADRVHFASMPEQSRAIVTQDLGDFRPLLSEAMRAGGKTYGLVCVPARVSLSREAIGRLVASLAQVLQGHPGDEDPIDRGGEVWLPDMVHTARSPRLLLATRNEHKRRELARLLPGFEVDALPDEVVLPAEDGDTFAANALGKARAAAATGRASIADDSGIEAAALGGAPGVRSARYAGEGATDEQNLAKLLAEAPAGSGLAYVCALAYVDPAMGEERLFEGRWSGRLAQTPRGERGFGYDPAFLPDEHPETTAAELTDERKDELSHRGRAVRALHAWLTAG